MDSVLLLNTKKESFLSKILSKTSKLKAVLRRCTGLCELQRICYADNLGAARTRAVEYSLQMSQDATLQRIHKRFNDLADDDQFCNHWEAVEEAIDKVMQVKKIDPKVHEAFRDPFRVCLVQIYGYRQLIARLDDIRGITFDPESEKHRKLLTTLWSKLSPDTELTGMISKQWSDIGFQGKDPSTDFRGMGLLSLENLVFFVTVYTDHARNILSHSLHPVHGYPFAAVGINITHLTLGLLKSGHLKTHLYNAESRIYTVEDFHKIYSYLFASFDKLWIRSKPASVMEFSHIRQKFETAVIQKLRDEKAVFKWDPFIENL